jgi:transposase-like protein
MMHPFSNLPLQGLIQADEAYFGGVKEGKRGRGSENKRIVAVAVEERTKMIDDEPTIVAGRACLEVIANASGDELANNFIETSIHTGSTIKTDGWSGYSPIDPKKYIHDPKAVCEDPDREHIKLAHRIISNVKNWLQGIFHGAVGRHLQRYLREFTYRFNRRNKIETIFARVVRNLLLGKPVLYKCLVGSKEQPRRFSAVGPSPLLSGVAVA